jgi:hypothetical protein
MTGALACGKLTVADPSSVDPMTLFNQALVVFAAEPKVSSACRLVQRDRRHA